MQGWHKLAGMKQIPRLLLLAASLMSLSAFAQWQWLDKDGRKVFSDLAPPASVPEKNILKRPGQSKTPTTPDGGAAGDTPPKVATPASSAQKAASAPLSALDKEVAERKKKAEQEEAAKRKADEERVNKAKAENCQRAKSAQKGLDSGLRMARINDKGEREILDDAARSAESKRLQGIVASDCQ